MNLGKTGRTVSLKLLEIVNVMFWALVALELIYAQAAVLLRVQGELPGDLEAGILFWVLMGVSLLACWLAHRHVDALIGELRKGTA